jgi:hypothetical protein
VSLPTSLKIEIPVIRRSDSDNMSVSSSQLENLGKKTLSISLRNVLVQLIFELVLRNIKTILEEKNLSFIVLKGPHLGNTIYSHPVERLYGDLDLLVRPQNFFPVIDLLQSNGYKRCLSDGKRLAKTRFYSSALTSPQGVRVEIHRDLAGYGRYPINLDGLFERAEIFKTGNVEARGLCPEDLLLHLCLHMTASYFRYIEKKHVKDIALLTQKRSINWDVFLKRVTDARCSHGVHYALLAARNQQHADIPDEVLQVLSPRGIRKRWLDTHLNPSAFPIYRYSNHKVCEVQIRLGLMLMDRFSDWIPFLWKYSGLRLRDTLMRKSIDGPGWKPYWSARIDGPDEMIRQA